MHMRIVLIHIYMRIDINNCIHTHIYSYIHISIYMYIDIHIYTYIYIYIYIYILNSRVSPEIPKVRWALGADWAWARRLSRAHVARVRRFGIGASYPRTPPWMGRVAGGPRTEERANPLREFDRFLLQNGFKVAHLDSPASEADLPRHREDSSEPRESRSARNPTHHGWQKHAANLQNSGRTSRGVRGRARKEKRPGRR